jgi:hypothetical protein
MGALLTRLMTCQVGGFFGFCESQKVLRQFPERYIYMILLVKHPVFSLFRVFTRLNGCLYKTN